jgi:CheY-like chemotaxis protein
MFNILIVDDDYEDRAILKLEIEKALLQQESNLRFFEASSINKARELLNTHVFDLMTLDIQFDRLNEGIDALPEFFETYPTLNIVMVSGKLDKSEVTNRLFRFTKDNILKGKRWARHFDVLDKKDDKTEALQRAYAFAVKQHTGGDRIRELFLLAESYLEKDMIDKCIEIYQDLQRLVPGDLESQENINIFQGDISVSQALEYYRRGEKVVAALLLGYLIQKKLKNFTERVLGYSRITLAECGRELEKHGRIKKYQLVVFQKLIQLRNQAIHQPSSLTEMDFDSGNNNLEALEEN